jgi:predicted nucleic acid-binding protein
MTRIHKRFNPENSDIRFIILAPQRFGGDCVRFYATLGYTWIEVISVSTPEYLNLIVDLGPGESEVLALATYYPRALVILDDKLARQIAEMQGFCYTGTVGVLLRAKEKRIIPALKPAIEKLLGLNFHLKHDLVDEILDLAKE